ncbi:MAG: 16S rRNA (cytidine(1402)-2'-O)-methyltransferase [Haliea sp.]|nr:16S rRNA (cytidine(1402)-2'-O)-methyltransferase [Haliea sp.]
MNSGLYVVATPIGNFGDMSQRAIEVLQGVDLIAAEDTRHSQRLLQHFAIHTPAMSYHDHSDERALQRIGKCLADGGSVALVSDAGTPLISDPGYRLVRYVQDAGFAVYPLPGPCAAIAALSVSGLPTDRFLFEGFLPAREVARSNRLAALAAEPMTLIFYEAPHRIEASLQAMIEAFGGEREAVLAREITKTFETIRRGALAALAQFVSADSNQQKGEIVIIVAGKPRGEQEISSDVSTWLLRLAQELPAKQAAAVVADCTGLRKNQLYEQLLELKRERGG